MNNEDVLHVLKTFAVDRISDIDQLLLFHSQATALSNSFTQFGLEQPEWLSRALNVLHREIKVRAAADLDRQVMESDARLASLKTQAEKRAEEEQRNARLKSLRAGGGQAGA